MTDTTSIITVGPKSAGELGDMTAERFAAVIKEMMGMGGIYFVADKAALLANKEEMQPKNKPWNENDHVLVKVTLEVLPYSETEHV